MKEITKRWTGGVRLWVEKRKPSSSHLGRGPGEKKKKRSAKVCYLLKAQIRKGWKYADRGRKG